MVGRPAWEICMRLTPPGRDPEAVGRRARKIVETAISRGRIPGPVTHATFDFLRADGAMRTAEHDMAVVESSAGHRLVAMVRDVTETLAEPDRDYDEEDHRRLFRETLNGIAVHEVVCDESGAVVDYRFLEVNPAFEALTGLKADDIIGRTAREVIPDLEPAWIERYGRVAMTGESTQFEQYNAALQKTFMVKAYRPAPRQFAAVFQDVTDIFERTAFAETIISSVGEGIVVVDRQGCYVVFNPVMERITGVAAAEALGRRPWDVFPSLRAVGVQDYVDRALRGETINSPEFELLQLGNRQHVWLISTYHPHRNSRGDIVGVVALVRDVTARHEAEEAVRESDTRMKTIFDSVADGIAIYDPGGAILEANQVMCDRLGYSREQLLGLTIQEIDTPESAALFPGRVAEIVRAGFSTFEVRHRRRDGSTIPIEAGSRLIEFRGKPAVLSVQRDISDRKKAEDSIRQQARFLQQLLDAIPIPITAKGTDGRVTITNRAFTNGPGLARPDTIGTVLDELDRASYALHKSHDDAVLAGGPIQVYEAPALVADGLVRRMVMTKAPLLAEDGTVNGVVSAALDITDRFEAEQGLRRSEERFRALFENAADSIFMWDPQGSFIEANQAACDRLGYSHEELLAMSPVDLDTPDEARLIAGRISRLMAQGRAFFETTHVRKDGTPFPVEMSLTTLDMGGRPVVLAIARDISERRRAEAERAALEDQLRQAQKMEEIGRLAGGIAHDFNNLLTAIRGNATLALAALPADSSVRDELHEIVQESDRAAALTRQLLAFARRTVLQPEVVDLSVIVRRLEPMLRRVLGEDISLVTRTPASRGAVLADPSQIEQVIVNLAVNARDAMPDGGTLTIETADVVLEQPQLRAHPTATPGPNAMIAVSDTGTGMDAATLEHLFEPFFTTKGVGKGTGLGLATVYGIVRQSGGSVWAKSAVGRGSTFYVYLPWIEAAAPVAEGQAPSPVSPRSEPRTGTILVVEDDDGVRRFAVRVLERAGYAVVSASGGAAALEADAGAPFDLLLTDVVMPSMNGREVADRMQARHPGLRTLFMSGHADKVIVKHGVLDAHIRYLAKPFTAEELLAAVDQAISDPAPDIHD
jgi:PAS domain S-box-containing protein